MRKRQPVGRVILNFSDVSLTNRRDLFSAPELGKAVITTQTIRSDPDRLFERRFFASKYLTSFWLVAAVSVKFLMSHPSVVTMNQKLAS